MPFLLVLTYPRCSMMLHQELAYPRSSMLLDIAEDEEEMGVLQQQTRLASSRHLMASVLEDPEAVPQG